ncbi:hypothetical protein HK097_002989 [Rhizophlyctis rosea]|uniref:Uncharacterized protein n=1 Tax=Rhizophlyctis rosea TaxID=64517 RepID=A0AAD5WY45_9FUNG|nr:hypothetical protein HK097_002989 [Rhizophlyctis rosea]
MLACQATCRWSEQSDARENFSRHFYRALLQVVIKELDLLPSVEDSRDIVVGRLGRDAFGRGFANYARNALERLRVDVERDVEGRKEFSGESGEGGVLEGFEERYGEREKEVAVVWTLRAMLAEAIESLILVDRFLCLLERSGEGDLGGEVVGSDAVDGEPNIPLVVMLVPVFEPVDSPRNMVIVAKKL